MRNLLLSTVTLLVVPAVSFAMPDFPTHTHTDTPIELKPVSHISGTKLAAVCFLGVGDCSSGGFDKGDIQYDIDTEKQCKNEGFTITSCSLPAYPDGQCPYNDSYFAKCSEDKPRACKESGYPTLSCDTGEVIDKSCPYESSYKKCKCNPCDGYDYTYAQATARGYVSDGSCQSCSETKYKRKANPCLGYQVCECGGTSGAAVCYTGTVQKFNSCKSCDPCPGYYDCGGSWQYCEGSVCSADASKCSSYCVSDYFPNACDNPADCSGIYRNGYCSGSCETKNDYPYYCSYSSLCSKAGGSWGGNNNCSVPCYIFIYDYDNFRCEGSGSSWKIMANQNDTCVDEDSGRTVSISITDQPPYNCRYTTYSSQSACTTAMNSCISNMNDELNSQADRYPVSAHYRGYYVTDIYCY